MSLSELESSPRRRLAVVAAAIALVAAGAIGVRLLAFGGARSADLFVVTGTLAGVVFALALGPALWLGWRIVHGQAWERRILALGLFGLWAWPLAITAAGWEAGFGRRGWWTADAEAFNDPLLSGFRAAAFLHAVAAVPWMSLLFAVAMSRTERELREDASLSGGGWSVFFRVDLPRMLPAIGVAAAWTVIVLFQEMTIADLYQVRTFAEEFYVAIQLRREGSSEVWSLLPEFALLAIAAIGALAACGFWASGDRTRVAYDAVDRPFPSARRSVGQGLAACLSIGVVALLTLLPTAMLIYRAGRDVSLASDGGPPVWSLAKASELLASAPAEYGREFGWSAAIAAATAAVVVPLASALAWSAGRSRLRSVIVMATVAILLPLPGPLLALALVRLLNQPGFGFANWLLDRTILAPVVACSLRILPLAILYFGYLYGRMPSEPVEQMALDGAGPITRWLHGGVLGVRGPFLAAAVAAFALAWGDLSAVHLSTPPGIETVTQRIFGLLHAGADDQVAALCLWNLLIFVILAMIAFVAFRGRISGLSDVGVDPLSGDEKKA